MTRPVIPPEQLEEMEKSFQNFLDGPPEDLGALKYIGKAGPAIEHIREIMFSGWWLEQHLTAVGCPKELLTQICFAHGQRCFGSKDMWREAQQALDDFKNGRVEKPGLELANRIINHRTKITNNGMEIIPK